MATPIVKVQPCSHIKLLMDISIAAPPKRVWASLTRHTGVVAPGLLHPAREAEDGH